MLEEAAFSVDTNGPQIVVRGDLDLATAPTLEQALVGLTGDVVVDCRFLEFIDSTGLSVLVQAHNRLQARQGRLEIAGLSERCRRVFEISGLDETLNLVP